MVAKLFTKPFGVAGDKTPIPNDTQVDGTVSYQTGFGADYERQLGVDPAAKNIGRQTFNELMFDTTTSLQEMQAGFGTSPFSAGLAAVLPGGGYPKGAFIPRSAGNGFWVSLVTANSTNPDTAPDPAAAGWAPISLPGRFYAVDAGAVNACSCTFSPALTAPRLESQPLTIKIANTNTGATTLFDGIATCPILGEANLPLEGGELVAGGYASLQWNAALAAYILLFCTGGASQVSPAIQKSQAITAGQLTSQNLVAFASTGVAGSLLLAPQPAITGYTTNQRYTVTFHVASTGSDTMNWSGLGAKSLKQYTNTGTKAAALFFAGQVCDVVYDGTDLVLISSPQSVEAASETIAGVIRKATTGEAAGGASDAGALTPIKAKAIFNARGLWDPSVTGTTNANLPRTTGVYAFSGTTNGPPVGGAFQVFSSTWGSDTTWQSDLALGISANSAYIRSIKKDQSAVTPWDKLYCTADFILTGASVGFYLSAPPIGWLRENGAAVSRTTYSALFAVIGTTYGAGDGSTTFNLPDSRSLFSRAADDGKGIDTGRLVGSSQAQSIQSHLHSILNKATNFIFSAPTGGNAPGLQATGATELTGGTETRPANIAKLYCIKY